MARKDIILEDNDLKIVNGDFLVTQSDLQHVRHILEANQGQYKEHPVIGVGIRKMLNGVIGGSERREISIHLTADGYRVRNIAFEDDKLTVEI